MSSENYYLIPLKLKYRTVHHSQGGKYHPRTGNSHGQQRVKGGQGKGHRRRSYNVNMH